MAFDPVIQKYMSHFYDVHGTLHITVKPELTVALGWAKPDLKDGMEVLQQCGQRQRQIQQCIEHAGQGQKSDETASKEQHAMMPQ